MKIHLIDSLIIFAYLLIVIIAGFLLSRKASKNMDSYFLGDKTVPWYILGISNTSGMFDISGTMWLVYMLFVYGLKGIWMPWMWPTFNQIFFMIYLSIWVRRSNVLTGAEWITTRFGSALGGELSRFSVVIFAIVSVIGFLTYAFIGIGKFASIFLPWDLSPEMYAVILMGITTIYVTLGGMYSVVVTDLIQYALLSITSIIIGVIAMVKISPQMLDKVIPAGWKELFFGWHLNLDWSNLIPSVNDKIASDGYSLFMIFFMMIVFKGILNSMAGPGPNYDLQRVLAAKTPKEAGLMNGIVSVCLIPRWIMVPAIAVLALVFFSPELKSMGTNIDFEMVLPIVINKFIPVGLMGVFLAGLIAAFMSTFDSTVNAGAAYIVNDVYKRYINPEGSDRNYVVASYIASFAVVIVGIIFGFMAKSVHQMTQWIVFGLWGGYTAPNLLKWHWWRFNAFGYFWGMIAGVIAALLWPLLFPNVSDVNSFPVILLFSGTASVIASLLTKPDDEEILKKFYRQVRPWGFWQPIYEKVVAENPEFNKNTNFLRDMANVFIGIVWQTSLRLIPVFLIVFRFKSTGVAIVLVIFTTYILKKNWYDKLEDD
jgi:Na+/proline symporter